MPGLTMVVAYLLALASFAALLPYVHHTGQSLRVAGLIDLVGDDLRDELDNRYGEPLADEAGGPAPGVIPARRPGWSARWTASVWSSSPPRPTADSSWCR